MENILRLDESEVRKIIRDHLEKEGYKVENVSHDAIGIDPKNPTPKVFFKITGSEKFIHVECIVESLTPSTQE